MRSLPIVIIALLLTGSTPSISMCDEVGRRCPPQAFPAGYADYGGWMITDPYAKVPQYSLSLTERRNGAKTVFLSRLLGRTEKGCAEWELVRSTDLPEQPAGTVLASDCRLQGRLDRTIFVYAMKTDEQEYTTILNAWRVNLDQETFVKISAKGIICVNEGYGL
jgi:hypothetical protein